MHTQFFLHCQFMCFRNKTHLVPQLVKVDPDIIKISNSTKRHLLPLYILIFYYNVFFGSILLSSWNIICSSIVLSLYLGILNIIKFFPLYLIPFNTAVLHKLKQMLDSVDSLTENESHTQLSTE